MVQLDVFRVTGAAVQGEHREAVQGYTASLLAQKISQQTVQVKATAHTHTGLKQKTPGKQAVQLQSVRLSSNVSGSSPEAELS